MNGQTELDPQYVINSLTNQIAENAANASLQIAKRDALIEAQETELEDYRKKEVAE